MLDIERPMRNGIYLDNNATTHLTKRVKRALHEFIDAEPGNPESPHSDGEAARMILRAARERVSNSLNIQEDHVLFTGSGSESNTYAIGRALAMLHDDLRAVVVSDLEHSSIEKGISRIESGSSSVIRAPVLENGRVDVDAIRTACQDGPVALFVQWANNETGVIQPIEAIAQIARESGSYLHVDAAQAFGRIPIDLAEVSVGSLAITAHKIHGPTGVAALAFDAKRAFCPVILGGQQEEGLRGGTHNMIGIRGFHEAVEERFNDLHGATERLRELRDEFEARVLSAEPRCEVQGGSSARVCNTSCITFFGADGGAMVAWLDAHGVQCSQTSACRSNRPEPSATLTAMGLSEADAYSSIRFAVSVLNTADEIDRAVELVIRAYRTLRA